MSARDDLRDLPHRDLLSQVQSGRPRRWWASGPDPRLPLLAEVGRRAEPDALPYLLAPAVEGGAVGMAAVTAADTVLQAAPVSEWPALSARVRREDWWLDDEWRRLGIRTLRQRAPEGWLRVPYFGLASFHRSGYVREAALQVLADEPSVQALPFLVLGLRDWVPQVREVAEAGARRRFTGDDAAGWAEVLPLLMRLEETGHRENDRSETVSAVARDAVRLLVQDEHAEALRTAWDSPVREVRRAAVRVSLASGTRVAAEAAHHAAQSGDLLLRVAAARWAADQSDLDLLHLLADDAAVGVRREALDALIALGGDGLDAVLLRALLDPSGFVRESARYHLRKRGADPSTFAPTYRNALNESSTAEALRGALGGLGESGDASDADLVLPYLADPRARVRVAAVQALARLAPHDHRDRLIAAAEDESPRVARAAFRALRDRDVVDVEQVAAGLLPHPLPHVGAEALRALASLPRWSALPYLLRAVPRPEIREQAVHGLRRWLAVSHRTFTAPSDEQRRRAEQAFPAAALHLPPRMASEVRDVLQRS